MGNSVNFLQKSSLKEASHFVVRHATLPTFMRLQATTLSHVGSKESASDSGKDRSSEDAWQPEKSTA
jgi:hypothetical protein